MYSHSVHSQVLFSRGLAHPLDSPQVKALPLNQQARGLPSDLEKHDEWQESNITSPSWHSITRTSTIEMADVMSVYSLGITC